MCVGGGGGVPGVLPRKILKTKYAGEAIDIYLVSFCKVSNLPELYQFVADFQRTVPPSIVCF